MRFTVILVLILASFWSVDGKTKNKNNSKNILLVTAASTSHCIELMAVGHALLQRGHRVTLFAIFEQQQCVDRFNATDFDNFQTIWPVLDPSIKEFTDKTMAEGEKNIFERAGLVKHIMSGMGKLMALGCECVFHDKNTLEKLKKEKFDIAIVDALQFVSCLFALPYYLDVPTVASSSYIDFQDCRGALQANTLPHFFTAFSNEMTFGQRLANTALTYLNPVIRMMLLPAPDLAQFNKKLENLKPIELVKHSLLFLENSDYVIDYPKAVFPNFVQVGGLSAAPAKPLPTDLNSFMDKSRKGVVLVTFGSMLGSFPEHFVKKLMDVFSQLEYSILFKTNIDEIKGNVKMMKWIPQNDVLGHQNTVLFLSHCGKNGFWESVYHGVPIICVPIHAETYITEAKVRKYGVGSSINIFDDTVDDIVVTMKQVLENKTYSEKMKRISVLLRDRPETPSARAATAVEHVLKYGGTHMQPPSVNFGFITYTNLDVMTALFAIDIILVWFFVWLVKKCCCRGKAGKRKTE